MEKGDGGSGPRTAYVGEPLEPAKHQILSKPKVGQKPQILAEATSDRDLPNVLAELVKNGTTIDSVDVYTKGVVTTGLVEVRVHVSISDEIGNSGIFDGSA